VSLFHPIFVKDLLAYSFLQLHWLQLLEEVVHCLEIGLLMQLRLLEEKVIVAYYIV
jgi:hypothetical protein